MRLSGLCRYQIVCRTPYLCVILIGLKKLACVTLTQTMTRQTIRGAPASIDGTSFALGKGRRSPFDFDRIHINGISTWALLQEKGYTTDQLGLFIMDLLKPE